MRIRGENKDKGEKERACDSTINESILERKEGIAENCKETVNEKNGRAYACTFD